jgi:hypothetical protein
VGRSGVVRALPLSPGPTSSSSWWPGAAGGSLVEPCQRASVPSALLPLPHWPGCAPGGGVAPAGASDGNLPPPLVYATGSLVDLLLVIAVAEQWRRRGRGSLLALLPDVRGCLPADGVVLTTALGQLPGFPSGYVGSQGVYRDASRRREAQLGTPVHTVRRRRRSVAPSAAARAAAGTVSGGERRSANAVVACDAAEEIR